MKKLIQGIVEFRKNLSEEKRELFAQLSLGQKPDALFIACSDSRVVPNLFASTNPGDLFVLRNVGNLIPPSDADLHDTSAQAALEFAVFSLNVTNIVVCGHSECGAMAALLEKPQCDCPHLTSWLKYGQGAANRLKNTDVNELSKINVLEQIEHLKSYPFIQDRLKRHQIQLHGWWFDIAHANVYCYEPSQKAFVLIDEKEAKIILERLG